MPGRVRTSVSKFESRLKLLMCSVKASSVLLWLGLAWASVVTMLILVVVTVVEMLPSSVPWL